MWKKGTSIITIVEHYIETLKIKKELFNEHSNAMTEPYFNFHDISKFDELLEYASQIDIYTAIKYWWEVGDIHCLDDLANKLRKLRNFYINLTRSTKNFISDMHFRKVEHITHILTMELDIES